MDEAGMLADLNARYAARPAHGSARILAATQASVAAADTFFASNYQFNADHDLTTQADVVHITAGQTVMFKWVVGVHSSTSGNPGDVDAGSLWDAPLSAGRSQAVVQFLDPGTYPFFCIYHGAFNYMVGTIVVHPAATPARATTWGGIMARFR
jgi:plastocyanin